MVIKNIKIYYKSNPLTLGGPRFIVQIDESKWIAMLRTTDAGDSLAD